MTIAELTELLNNITEKEATGFCFEVRHKILDIPHDLYLEAVSEYDNPYSEKAAQYVIEEYLDWKDEQGLPGMIRINKQQDEKIELDAAVRYLVECEESSCKEC